MIVYSQENPRALMESLRWPNGIICPKCKSDKGAWPIKSKPETKVKNRIRSGAYNCKDCYKTFTVTTETIFHRTHLPLAKCIEMVLLVLQDMSIEKIHTNLEISRMAAFRMSKLITMALEENKMDDAYQEYLSNPNSNFTWEVLEAALRRVLSLPKGQLVSTESFSKAKQRIQLEKAKERAARRWQEEELIGLLLYKGNLKMRRAQGLLNFLLMMLDANIEDINQISRMSKDSKDLRHLAGLHQGISIIGLRGFLFRVRNTPKILVSEPLLLEYTDHLTGGNYSKLTPIQRWSRRTPQSWRYKKPIRKKRRKIHYITPPLPEFYPFIVEDVTQEHSLLMTIHNAVPKGLPKGIREDVCQDLLVAILSNEFTIEELPDKIKPFITQTWRMYPGKYGALSLDAPPPWSDDGRTLLQTIVDETQTLR